MLPQIVILLATLPVLLYLCHRFRLAWGLWVSAVLFPLFGTAALCAGRFLYNRLGTRITLCVRTRRLKAEGWAHADHASRSFQGGPAGALARISLSALQPQRSCKEFSFDDIAGVQLIPAAQRTYQLNLVLKDASRYNLLHGGGFSRLNVVATEIARAVNVPLHADR